MRMWCEARVRESSSLYIRRSSTAHETFAFEGERHDRCVGHTAPLLCTASLYTSSPPRVRVGSEPGANRRFPRRKKKTASSDFSLASDEAVFVSRGRAQQQSQERTRRTTKDLRRRRRRTHALSRSLARSIVYQTPRSARQGVSSATFTLAPDFVPRSVRSRKNKRCPLAAVICKFASSRHTRTPTSTNTQTHDAART